MATWEGADLRWGSGAMPYPAVVRLTYEIRRVFRQAKFNRRAVFRRDMYACQYCGISLKPSKLTLDHIIPVSRGGQSSWINCITSCFACNSKKSNKTLEQANMKLMNVPKAPAEPLTIEYILMKPKHADWQFYFKDVERIMPKSHVEFDEDEEDWS